jgi:hypothetical protein
VVRLALIVPPLIALMTCQPLLAAEGCPYLTDAEVEEVTGRELSLFKLTSLPLPDGAGTVCDSSIVRVLVLPGPDAGSRWEGMLTAAGRADEKRFSRPEVGEGAYALHLEPRAESESPTAVVVVTTDSYTLAVSVRAAEGRAAAAAEPEAIELLRFAEPRIQ